MKMKFYCKSCEAKFGGEYNNLFEHLTCPKCKKEDIVLKFIVQGIHPPEEGLGLSFWEFEDVLENGKEDYLKEFFKDEFGIKYDRSGEIYTLNDETGKEVEIKEIYDKTQKDGKLQRIIYNIHYVMMQGN